MEKYYKDVEFSPNEPDELIEETLAELISRA